MYRSDILYALAFLSRTLAKTTTYALGAFLIFMYKIFKYKTIQFYHDSVADIKIGSKNPMEFLETLQKTLGDELQWVVYLRNDNLPQTDTQDNAVGHCKQGVS